MTITLSDPKPTLLDRDEFVATPHELIERHGDRLRALIGRTIDETFVAWDTASDTWFADEAVIVRAGSDSVEVVCWKLSEIGVSWNAIDTSMPAAWVADWAKTEFVLEWRRDALPVLQRAVGRAIRGVAVVEYLFRTTVIADRNDAHRIGHESASWLLHGIELGHDDGVLVIYNALDKNGVSDEPVTGPDFHRTPL